MSEKTLEKEILTINCRGIEEADRIRGEFTHTDDIDRNLNELAQRMTNAILSLVVARLENVQRTTAERKGLICSSCIRRVADCIQAIRGKDES